MTKQNEARQDKREQGFFFEEKANVCIEGVCD